jgi:hypothetical protein
VPVRAEGDPIRVNEITLHARSCAEFGDQIFPFAYAKLWTARQEATVSAERTASPDISPLVQLMNSFQPDTADTGRHERSSL